MKFSYVGLGKLGLPIAVYMAACGFEVVGVDRNPRLVEQLNAGSPDAAEPGVTDLLDRAGDRFAATTDLAYAVRQTDITFVLVPTPGAPFSTENVVDVMFGVGRALREKAGHLVVVQSTVMPGDCEGKLIPALEAASGRRVGADGLLFAYNPELVAMAEVVETYSKPEYVVLGEHDACAGDVLTSVFRALLPNNPPIKRMSLINAEITKLRHNVRRALAIVFANETGELCEQFPGADSDVVADALACDQRLARFNKAGLGFGGTCFPRDVIATEHVLHEAGLPREMTRAVDTLNQRPITRTVDLVLQALAGRSRVGVLGLAFKLGTPVIEASQPLEIAIRLADQGLDVRVYDPLLPLHLADVRLVGELEPADSAQACVDQSDVVVVALPYPAFANLRYRPDQTVIDPWRTLDPSTSEAKLIQFGRFCQLPPAEAGSLRE